MSDFRKDLNKGEIKEFELSEFLNYINYGKFYHVKKLDEYSDLSDDIKQKIISHCEQNGQTDLVKLISDGIEPIEVKYDAPDANTNNLFVEFKDVRDNGTIKVTGPWRSVEKKEKWWYHFRDKKWKHGEDAILYIFDPKKLADFVDSKKIGYRKTSIRNIAWVTWGWLVPMSDIEDICEFKIKISDEDYERFFSSGELSAASH